MLLNELHSLMADWGPAYRFALSGSSARKLERTEANLLAGRAINRQFFPLVAAELGNEPDSEEILRFVLLPQIRMDPALAVDCWTHMWRTTYARISSRKRWYETSTPSLDFWKSQR